MTNIEFQPWPKIARLNRDITITEKLDGTNAAVVIVPFRPENEYPVDPLGGGPMSVASVRDGSGVLNEVFAQSRTRFITPGKSTDNYGFAGWVAANAEALVATLGEGTHYGEWWGASIQRKYGFTGNDKHFSLFNTKRWVLEEGAIGTDAYAAAVPGLGVVPVIYEGPFSQNAIDASLDALRLVSVAAPGFHDPEGIVIFHHASREMYKVTLEGDAAPKGVEAHAKDEELIAA